MNLRGVANTSLEIIDEARFLKKRLCQKWQNMYKCFRSFSILQLSFAQSNYFVFGRYVAKKNLHFLITITLKSFTKFFI
jgi:hypothetical protein